MYSKTQMIIKSQFCGGANLIKETEQGNSVIYSFASLFEFQILTSKNVTVSLGRSYTQSVPTN